MALAVAAAGAADASPSFARKYNVSCHSCHADAYPELNALGRDFKERGFQMPEGAESSYRTRATLAPGTIDERIGLLRELPLAARAVGVAQVPLDARASDRNAVDFRLLEDLYLILGGSPYRDVSVFASATIAPTPTLHHASIGLHNLLGDGLLNVRAGELLLLDFLQPGHRALNRVQNLGALTKVGLNPTSLDSSQLGLQVYGRLLGRQAFYDVAVVQGAKGPDGISDLDDHKDVFAQLQWTFREQDVVGLLGYYGRTQLTDTAREVSVRFTDPFYILGADVEVHQGPVRFFGYGLYGRHQNPLGSDEPASYVGARGDLTVSLTRELLARLRYDGVFSRDLPDLEQHVLSAHATYLLLTNLKASLELAADLKAFNRSTAYVLLDVAL